MTEQKDYLIRLGVEDTVIDHNTWGQRTLENNVVGEWDVNIPDTDFSGVLGDIERVLMEHCLFEFNDEATRNKIRNKIRFVMESQPMRQVSMTCDETNNSPESVDRNELHCSVSLRPSQIIGNIDYNMVLS